ncbi:MAG: hypothetical protein IKV03_05210 [Alphaproteobacteria bacterium]|nr:hypothetical protein [Alphaproteobacteria bacterium]
MGYKKNNILSHDLIELREKQKGEWLAILLERSYNLFGSLLPHKKLPSLVSAFMDMPQVDQMYLCGLLNDAQFVEMRREAEKYCLECEMLIRNNYEEELHGEQFVSIVAPTFSEIQNRLFDGAFHDPIMNEYVKVVEKIQSASTIYDLNNLNVANDMLSLEDEQKITPIVEKNNPFVSDMRALEICLLIRNGCLLVPEEHNAYLNGAVNRFCLDALSVLKNVPENEYTLGASQRAEWSYGLLGSLFRGDGLILKGQSELIMGDILKGTQALLAFQSNYDKEWRDYLVKWFDDLMLPYSCSLVERVGGAQKVSDQKRFPKEDNGRERDV